MDSQVARAHARVVDELERLREAVADTDTPSGGAARSLAGIRVSLDGWAETWLDDDRGQ